MKYHMLNILGTFYYHSNDNLCVIAEAGEDSCDEGPLPSHTQHSMYALPFFFCCSVFKHYSIRFYLDHYINKTGV